MARAYIDQEYYKRIKQYAAKKNITIKEAHEKIIDKSLDKNGQPKIRELEDVVL